MTPFQATRLRQLFEFLVFWGGGTTGSAMAHKAKLRRETILRDVCLVFTGRHVGKKAINYDPRAHLYRCTQAALFSDMRLAPRTPYAVLVGAESERLWAQARGEVPFFDLPVEDVLSQVAFTFPHERFQPFVEAILRRHAVSLHYRAKTGNMHALFSPHTIVKTSFRVHIRGHALWQDGYSMFIDIVPGRVLEAEIDSQANYIGMQNDQAWNEFVDMDVRLCQDVPENIVEA